MPDETAQELLGAEATLSLEIVAGKQRRLLVRVDVDVEVVNHLAKRVHVDARRALARRLKARTSVRDQNEKRAHKQTHERGVEKESMMRKKC